MCVGRKALGAKQLRYAHEALFALNLALVLKLEGNQVPNRFFSVLDFGEASLQSRINRYFQLHPHSAVGGNIAFIVPALVLALLLFALIRIAVASSLIRKVFVSAAGIVSLIALPVVWLSVVRLIGVAPPLPNPPHLLLYFELFTATACAFLYLYAYWPIPGWVSIAMLAVHFGFWDWIISRGPYFWLNPFSLIFPLTGFFATLLWAITVSRTATQVAHA
jgi:hypothetical protein